MFVKFFKNTEKHEEEKERATMPPFSFLKMHSQFFFNWRKYIAISQENSSKLKTPKP